MQKTIVIIPCYNEKDRIQKSIFHNYLKQNPSISLFFVDDGSTDDTFSILKEFSDQHLNALSLRLPINGGKGEAIRQALLLIIEQYDFQFIGYFDADLSTSLEYIQKFLLKFEEYEKLKIVIGARIRRLGATISRNPIRHIFGRIVATLASLILNLPVYDTQCGAKIFEVNFVKDIFNKPFVTKWLFDIEIFARLNSIYGSEIIIHHVLEYPLKEWIDIGNSRIKFKDFFKVPMDLFKIALKYK